MFVPPGHLWHAGLMLHLIRKDANQNKRSLFSENKMTNFLATMCLTHVFLTLQLDATASQLNSNDVFVLVTPGSGFLWMGVGASDRERQGAQQLCDILGVSADELFEGGENGEEQRAVNKCYFTFLTPSL